MSKSPFQLVAHSSFLQQVQTFQQERPEAWNSLVTQLKRTCDDTFNAGSPLKGLPSQLAGKVRKIWVKGSNGYRLIFIVHQPAGIILGVMISIVSRNNFNYDDPRWIDMAVEIYNDFTNGKKDKFQILRLG